MNLLRRMTDGSSIVSKETSKIIMLIDEEAKLIFRTKDGTEYNLDFVKILEDYGVKKEE